jgi:hypothetical protein
MWLDAPRSAAGPQIQDRLDSVAEFDPSLEYAPQTASFPAPGVVLIQADAAKLTLRQIRLARPDEVFLYRQAAEANKLSDDKLVYLIELDVVVSFR